MYKHIYGPVPSRRLGISLGIDLVPLKICNFNCVYCECGKSPMLTNERKEYVPVAEVLEEVRDFLKNNPMPDYLTLSGSGEPTLNSGTGQLIDNIKREFPEAKIAVLTNGSLLGNEKVRADLMNADLVLPNLDGATKSAYIRIDRPHPDLKLEDILEGIRRFAMEFRFKDPRKEIWLEVFIVEGVNTDKDNISALREAIRKIDPDRVQLNTLDRPGAEKNIAPASRKTLEKVKKGLNLPHVEIVSRFRDKKDFKSYRKDIEETILDTVSRRPSTVEDLAGILGLKESDLMKYIDLLESGRKIKAEVGSGKNRRGIFYRSLKD